MSRNRKKTVSAGSAAEAASGEAVGTVKLNRSVKVGGIMRRAGSVLTDLSPELAFEIVDAGWGDWEQVGVPLDEITDEDGNPVDLSGLQTDETGAGDGEGDGAEQNSETA